MTVIQDKKPEPRITVINEILKRVAEIYVEADLSPDEMGILSLCTLQAMLEHCIRTKVDCPSKLGITTPKGYQINYSIEKPMQANPDPMAQLTHLAAKFKKDGE